eukprot:6213749-Pleurochrysis_carterae.AAC.3
MQAEPILRLYGAQRRSMKQLQIAKEVDTTAWLREAVVGVGLGATALSTDATSSFDHAISLLHSMHARRPGRFLAPAVRALKW